MSNERTGLKLKIGDKGKLTFDGKKPNRDDLNPAGRKIYDAITGSKTVNIEVGRQGGSVDFETSASVDDDGNLYDRPQIIDFADTDEANKAKLPDFNEQTIALHGTIEAIGIQKEGLTPGEAHAAANELAPGIEVAPGTKSQFTSDRTYTTQFQVIGGGSKFNVDFRFRQPVPTGT